MGQLPEKYQRLRLNRILQEVSTGIASSTTLRLDQGNQCFKSLKKNTRNILGTIDVQVRQFDLKRIGLNLKFSTPY
ncbi:hypothetical protein [Vibrio vulnificus]|uniref:hypothetical protein n=1 Tax=Vibrio vulnificus TaxID=672 RepID=UPI00222E1B1C|nr:hypothetical protein [Vibrio vulnificus]